MSWVEVGIGWVEVDGVHSTALLKVATHTRFKCILSELRRFSFFNFVSSCYTNGHKQGLLLAQI